MDAATWIGGIGLAVSVVGLTFAIWQIRLARKAAENAKAASEQTATEVRRFRNKLQLVSDLVSFEQAMLHLEGVKDFVRHGVFRVVPDKITESIRLLNGIRAKSLHLKRKPQTVIQECVVELRSIERDVGQCILESKNPEQPDAIVNQVSIQIDVLYPILGDLQRLIGDEHE